MCERCKTTETDESSQRPPQWGETQEFRQIGLTLLHQEKSPEMLEWLQKVASQSKTYV